MSLIRENPKILNNKLTIYNKDFQQTLQSKMRYQRDGLGHEFLFKKKNKKIIIKSKT